MASHDSQVQNFPQNQLQEDNLLMVSKEEANREKQEGAKVQDELLIEEDEAPVVQETMLAEKEKKKDTKWGEDDDDLSLDGSDDDLDQLAAQEETPEVSKVEEAERGLVRGEKKKPKGKRTTIDLVIQGEFEEALIVLKKQVGVIEPEPFREIFVGIYSHQSLMMATPLATQPSLVQLSSPAVTVARLQQQIQQAGELLDEYALEESLALLRSTILMTPLLTEDPLNEYPSLVSSAKEYIMAIQLESRKRSKSLGTEEAVQLNLYQCLCKVQDSHKVLFLKSAMLQLYKEKCFIYANWVALRLLGLLHTMDA